MEKDFKTQLYNKEAQIIQLQTKIDLLSGSKKTLTTPEIKRVFISNSSKGKQNINYNNFDDNGITVNAICPGYFYSPLTRETLDSEFFQNNAKTMITSERYGNEGELDTAAIFLSSPASSYVNGVILPVDGGYTAM